MTKNEAVERLLNCGSGLFEFRSDTTEERHMMASWAAINASWGALELRLWLAFAPIDTALSREWAVHFFEEESKKKVRVRKALEAIAPSDAEFQRLLNEALAAVQSAKDARNPLAHGVWTRQGTAIVVLPLRVDDAGTLADPIFVTPQLLSDINRRIRRAVNLLAVLGAECLAHDWLKKYAARRAKAIAGSG